MGSTDAEYANGQLECGWLASWYGVWKSMLLCKEVCVRVYKRLNW